MTDPRKVVPHYYYPRPESIPMLCEIENGYVYDLSSVIRRVDEYPGRFVRLAPVVEAPQPDWSQAEDWAMWWAISADGCQAWYAVEPQLLTAFGEWTAPPSTEVRHDGMIDIPLGVDWRLLKQPRPVAQTAGGGGCE